MSVYPRGVPVNLVERFKTIDPLTEVATLADPTTVTFKVRGPDDVVTTYVFGVDVNVTNHGVGVYVCALAPPLPTGSYEWVSIGAGAVVAESPVRTFEILPDEVLPPSPSPVPVPGPCSPWITPEEVAESCDGAGVGSDTWLLETVAEAASSLMFELSGRLYNGICERTIRPCRSGCGCWPASSGLPFEWAVGGFGGVGWWRNECGDTCGCGSESYVPLSGYPVREIVAVKIDGQVVDATSYRLEENRRLLRLSDPGPPVVARQWPTCQDLTLDDAQPGTFSISYRWGINPPELGKLAASQLACELFKAGTGGKCALPSSATRVVRQGVTIDRIPALAALFRQGATGLKLVDAFIAEANPNGISRRPAVYSPDVDRPGRRVS